MESSTSIESLQSKLLTEVLKNRNHHRSYSFKKILLISLLLLSSLHIFIELVLLFADYLDYHLPEDVVKKPKSLLALFIAFSLFRTAQLLATMLDLPLAMFMLAWANLNLDILLLARFTWYLFISGFSLTAVFLSRLLMLLLELTIPALTWCHLKSLRRERQARKMVLVMRDGGSPFESSSLPS